MHPVDQVPFRQWARLQFCQHQVPEVRLGHRMKVHPKGLGVVEARTFDITVGNDPERTASRLQLRGPDLPVQRFVADDATQQVPRLTFEGHRCQVPGGRFAFHLIVGSVGVHRARRIVVGDGRGPDDGTDGQVGVQAPEDLLFDQALEEERHLQPRKEQVTFFRRWEAWTSVCSDASAGPIGREFRPYVWRCRRSKLHV